MVNLPGATSVALDLTPITKGAPEILFSLPVGVNVTTALSVTNAPASGVLAAFVLVVHGNSGSAITWPSNFLWPQGIVPSLSGVAGKLDTFVGYTLNGGATFYTFVAGQNQ
ncbi:hypothetical protein [Paraburkholderia adhaesiva]|uniref:hypothetical protein n=1 Tax=Paraburkholderia adhaesiva TaxID=2883244 RepID=UPI001F2C7B64|nr:hypothetical protein [Paraburkholderia adhaesiva]